MYSKVNTCVLQGLNGSIIEVESDLSRGLPVFNIVGLADAAIKESKERVRTAIKNSNYNFPLNRITINLAPANLRKEGSQMDLAIAIGVLIADGIVLSNELENTIFLGELSLDGAINSIDGLLPMIISMRELGIKKCIIPFDNKDECCLFTDIDIIPVQNLGQVVDYLNNEIEIAPYKRVDNPQKVDYDYNIDFAEIKGQEG